MSGLLEPYTSYFVVNNKISVKIYKLKIPLIESNQTTFQHLFWSSAVILQI